MAAKVKRPGRYQDRQIKHKPRGIKNHEFEKIYWPYLPLLLVISVLLVFSVQGGALSRTIKYKKTHVLAYSTSMSTSGLLTDTNSARSSNGESPLTINSQLNAAAQAKASDMATRNYWSHNTPEGNPPWTFVTAQGYSYQKLGENLAAGFTDEQSTVNGWMASPPHRENILDAGYQEVGFGSANNPNYTSGGGGPMTIVVAYYGKPTTPVAQASTSTLKPVSSTPATSSTPAASTSSTPVAEEQSIPVIESTPSESDNKSTELGASVSKPVTTDSTVKQGTYSVHTSSAQVALADLPLSNFGTVFAVLAGFAAIGLWISRHALNLRKTLKYGEAFVFAHPLIDVGLIVITALAFLLTQTVGLIQ